MKSQKEESNMTKEELQITSFQIISYAGDAYSHFFTAVELAEEGRYEEADAEIKAGDEQLVEAHKFQTQLLTAEASNEELEIGVILVHSQDHLMTTIMYERVAKQLIKLLKRVNDLEKKG